MYLNRIPVFLSEVGDLTLWFRSLLGESLWIRRKGKTYLLLKSRCAKLRKNLTKVILQFIPEGSNLTGPSNTKKPRKSFSKLGELQAKNRIKTSTEEEVKLIHEDRNR